MNRTFHKLTIFLFLILLVGISAVAAADTGSMSIAETDAYRLTISNIDKIEKLIGPEGESSDSESIPVYILPQGSTITLMAKIDGVKQRLLYSNESNRVVNSYSMSHDGTLLATRDEMKADSGVFYTVTKEDATFTYMVVEIQSGGETIYYYIVVSDRIVQPKPVAPQSVAGLVVSAIPTSSEVLVDGKVQEFQAYTINQYNYFKLRDIAQVLTGTGKQFEVSWDGTNKAISLSTGVPYTTQGGELTITAGATTEKAMATQSTLYLDGQQLDLEAYEINDYTYFKLRDLGEALDFGVSWDPVTKAIGIHTGEAYQE